MVIKISGLPEEEGADARKKLVQEIKDIYFHFFPYFIMDEEDFNLANDAPSVYLHQLRCTLADIPAAISQRKFELMFEFILLSLGSFVIISKKNFGSVSVFLEKKEEKIRVGSIPVISR